MYFWRENEVIRTVIMNHLNTWTLKENNSLIKRNDIRGTHIKNN